MTIQDKPLRLTYALPPKPTAAEAKHSSVALRIGSKTFACRSTLDGITMLEFAQVAANMDEDAEGMTPKQAAESSGAILTLLQSVIVDYPAFRTFVKTSGIGIELLSKMAMDLVEEYTDRPTP